MTKVETVKAWLGKAVHVAALTGAGISAESGVPVFRGSGGLWRKLKPETLATPEAFARDPKLVWEWYDWRRARVAQAQPNPGHRALAQLERSIENFTLITQNVDGLHDRAGSRNPLKLHGDLWTLRCLDCSNEAVNYAVPLQELPPRCTCGGLQRPSVVWFGEALPAKVLERAVQASSHAEVFLVIGTSAVVHPAASLALLAKQKGARLVEINVEETPLSSYADVSLQGPSGEVLPLLLNEELVR